MIIDEIRSLALSAAVGFVVVVLVGSWLGAAGDVVVPATLGVSVLFYLGWCRLFRTRTCPRCGGDREWTDRHGHQRTRNCRRCGGDGRERRLGAVLQGLSKRS